eukprot:CAMPEP_0119340060 /NCGR_PEP_ID=MMETSP1333-20130426/99591_1 /TAXON_ID=418940 /ORGANISM="Scyphosphaera apsteinii, Strain RCC1455" /LENGTH=296 /DNA_ID=CAMNT_0007351719 /DNA_START=149 /DNA_END=1039 /DNA_ORIENTATION=-
MGTGWRYRVRSAGKALVAALALAGASRSPAFAVEEAQTLTSSSNSIGSRGSIDRINSQRRDTGGVVQVSVRAAEPQIIDLDTVVGRSTIRRFTDRDALFDESLVANSPLEEELEELAMARAFDQRGRALRPIATIGISVGMLFYTAKGMKAMERWMKAAEIRDMEQEIELTGTYIGIDAGDVETAIDPKTGKNITITRTKGINEGKAASAARGGSDAFNVTWMPGWFNNFMNSAPSEDDFWNPPSTSLPKPKPKGGGGGVDGNGGASGGLDSGDGGDDGPEDDLSGLNLLDELTGN